MKSNLSTLGIILAIQLLALNVSSFTPIVPTKVVKGIKNDSSKSVLFRKQYKNPNLRQHYMSEKEDDDVQSPPSSEVDASIDNESVDQTTKKEQSGFLTALFLGPPLIAKFAIVLVVKFLTDLVVFPLLVLYRLCKSLKNKVLNVFKSEDLSGDKTNGAAETS